MRETTIKHDFVGPAVLECESEEIGKIDEIYRGERGREQRRALFNAGPVQLQEDDEGGPSRRVSLRRRSKAGRGTSGGAWIFLMFIALLFFAVVYGSYTRHGSGISRLPHDPATGDAPGGAVGPSRISSAEDQTDGAPDTHGTR